MQISSIIFSVIAACISIGGVFIAIGMLKGKIQQNSETNKDQEEQIKKLATKDELAAAIKHSEELIRIMKERAEEDRSKGQGQYREFYNLLTLHGERIKGLETWQNSIVDSLKEIKVNLREGFKKLEEDLKELGKRV